MFFGYFSAKINALIPILKEILGVTYLWLYLENAWLDMVCYLLHIILLDQYTLLSR